MHGRARHEAPNCTTENNVRDKLGNTQDAASETSSRSSDKSVDGDEQVDNAVCEDGQPTAPNEDPLQREEDVSGYPSLDVMDNNSDIAEKDNLKSSATGDRNSELDDELSESAEDTPRRDSRTELLRHEKHKTENVNESPNGDVPSKVPEISLELSETNESSTPLLPSAKSSPSKTLWRNVGGSFTKSSDDLPPVHTEAQLSSADFNVAVITYKRSTSSDYSKVDIHGHDDDEHPSAQYSDISTSWATGFRTQFTVLLQRTFKQSKPEILSKLNFTQVCNGTAFIQRILPM